METVDRSLKDRLFDTVPYTSKPNLMNREPLIRQDAHKAEA